MARLNKEQKYLQENPDATPYEMFMAGAIDQKRYDELNSDNSGKSTQSVQDFLKSQTQSVGEFLESKPTQSVDQFLEKKKLVPSRVILHTNYPTLETYHPPKSGNVYLNDKKRGKATFMDRGAAERWRKKDPSRYTIS